MKKLLSILGAVGLVATASSGVVACTSSLASGSMDVTIDPAEKDSVTGNNYVAFSNALDKKINDVTGYWKYNNDLGAKLLKTKAGSDDYAAIANKVVIAIYKVNGTFYLGTQEFYQEAVNNFLAKPDDQATTRNKIELQVQMTSLWSLLNVKGTKDADYGAKLSKLIKVTDKGNDKADLTFDMSAITNEFGKMTSKDLDQACKKAKADIKSVKLEINFSFKRQ